MFLPEWYSQKGILMAWPHDATDWTEDLEATEACYSTIIAAITDHEEVYLLCHDAENVSRKLKDLPHFDRIIFLPADYNDTWTRDFGPIAVSNKDGDVSFLDFGFNGWGKKFEAGKDNALNKLLAAKKIIPNLTDVN
ncbi:MAG: agmatine deiminase family protein, partial [Cyclobacteriaceae bacterium]